MSFNFFQEELFWGGEASPRALADRTLIMFCNHLSRGLLCVSYFLNMPIMHCLFLSSGIISKQHAQTLQLIFVYRSLCSYFLKIYIGKSLKTARLLHRIAELSKTECLGLCCISLAQSKEVIFLAVELFKVILSEKKNFDLMTFASFL